MSLCLIIPYRIILFLIFLIFLRFFIMRFGHSFFQNPLTTHISSGSYAATVTYRAETGFLKRSESAFQRCVHPRGAFFVIGKSEELSYHTKSSRREEPVFRFGSQNRSYISLPSVFTSEVPVRSLLQTFHRPCRTWGEPV